MCGRYLQSLLRTTRLDALLAKHAEMLLEIKNLDSDMQMLVYENYNRFICATDTIRTMKSNVDNMDASMQQLHSVTGAHPLPPVTCRAALNGPFHSACAPCIRDVAACMQACCRAGSVAERSEAVNGKLQLRRNQIEELSQVKGLLAKLQAVFDLPRRLHAALDQGALEIAADVYADAAPLLKRYGHKVLAVSLLRKRAVPSWMHAVLVLHSCQTHLKHTSEPYKG